MSEAQTTEATTEKKKEPTGRTPIYAEFSPDTVVTFGVDSEGKSYGPDHGPYRAESRREERWKELVSSMTVHDVLTKTKNSAKNIRIMAERGWIILTEAKTKKH